MDKTSFEFERWCEMYELNEDTVKTLVEKGHKSHLSISVMVIEDTRKDFKKLLPAQVLLLERAVMDFHKASALINTSEDTRNIMTDKAPPAQDTLTPSASVPVNTPSPTHVSTSAAPTPPAPQGSLSVEEVLQRCGLTGGDGHTAEPGTCELATDPYGFGAGHYSSKLRDVGKFISFHQAGNSEDNAQYVTIAGVKLSTTENSRIPLNKIGPQHYMEGALAILREMIIADNIPLPCVLDHLNYLIQIARFGQVYPWLSVLRYDAVYRKQQHEVGFRWGCASPTLMQTHLQAQNGSQQKSQDRSQKDPRDPQTGRVICYRWNSAAGCPLFACKFSHVCRTCFSSEHPQHRHGNQQPTPKKH